MSKVSVANISRGSHNSKPRPPRFREVSEARRTGERRRRWARPDACRFANHSLNQSSNEVNFIGCFSWCSFTADLKLISLTLTAACGSGKIVKRDKLSHPFAKRFWQFQPGRLVWYERDSNRRNPSRWLCAQNHSLGISARPRSTTRSIDNQLTTVTVDVPSASREAKNACWLSFAEN